MKFYKLFIAFLFIGLTGNLLASIPVFSDSKETDKDKLVSKSIITEDENTEDEEEMGPAPKNLGPIFNGAYINVSSGVNMYYGDLAAYNLLPRPSQFKDHITSAFKATIGREIKWGLGAQISYQRGSLIGKRKTGRHSSTHAFRNSFFDLSLQVNYILNDALFKKTEYNRFYLYAHAGFGLVWYRSQMFDPITLNTKDYEGYIEVDNTEDLAQKTLSDKVKRAKTMAIPYGLRLNYRYNYKIDIHLDFTQTTTFTDRLDAWSRGWTAKDKYNYIGIGITYNFNRSHDDAPKKKPKKEIEKDTLNDEVSTPSTGQKKSLFGKKKKVNKEEDELLNLRLKLFETQLKLFEMQYLINN